MVTSEEVFKQLCKNCSLIIASLRKTSSRTLGKEDHLPLRKVGFKGCLEHGTVSDDFVTREEMEEIKGCFIVGHGELDRIF